MRKVPGEHDCVATGMSAGNLYAQRSVMRMIVTIMLRNRLTHTIRKLNEKYAEFDMIHVSELLQKVKYDEAIIQIFINADAYL